MPAVQQRAHGLLPARRSKRFTLTVKSLCADRSRWKRRAPKTGFIGAEFGETNDVFVCRNKMVYQDAPSGKQPPQLEWVFTRLDNGAKVGVNYSLAVITPVATPERQKMGKKMAAGTATPEEAADYHEYWNDRAKFVLDKADLDGFFTVTVCEE